MLKSLLIKCRPLLLFGLLGGVVFFFCQFTHARLWNTEGLNNATLIGDYSIFSAAGARAWNGDPLYVPSGHPEHPGSLYCYPPLLGVLLAPVSLLPFWAQNLFWYGLLSGCFVLSYYLLERTAALLGFAPPPGWRLIGMTSSFLLFYEPVQNNYIYAQSNVLVLLCIVLFLYLYVRGRSVGAACFAGLGAALKFFPLIFFPYLFWRREWKALAIAGGALLAFSAVSFVAADDGHYRGFLWSMRERGGSEYAFVEFFATLYRTVCWFVPAAASKLTQVLCAGALMGAALVLDLRLRPWSDRDPKHAVWILAILCNFILLIHPHTEMHIVIFCYPAYILSGYWVVFRGDLATRILWGVSWLLYVPLLDAQGFPLMTASLLLNSILCAQIYRREMRAVALTTHGAETPANS